MEHNYYFIYDNLSEIIFITYDTKLAFLISIASKHLFPNFYHIPVINKNFKSSYSSWRLINFIRPKELTFDDQFTNPMQAYQDLTTLTSLNHLKINGFLGYPRSISEKSTEAIDLSHFKYLTSLCFNSDNAIEKIKFNYSNVKKLKNTICTQNVDDYFKFRELQSLHLKMKISIPTLFFQSCIYSKLTHLTVKYYKNRYMYLNSIYCDNLLELCLDNGSMQFQSHVLKSLTSLTMIHNMYYAHDSMLRLRSLTFANNGNLNLSDFVGINNITHLCFENVDNLNVGYPFRTNDISYISKLNSLLVLEIKKCKHAKGIDVLRKHCSKNLTVLID